MDYMTNVLLSANDFNGAITTATKSLNIAVQLYGLDSHESVSHHSQLANLFIETRRFPQAIEHLLTQKYLLVLLGGPHHPDLAKVYSQLASIYNENKQYQLALDCLLEAKMRVTDLSKCHLVMQSLAQVLMKVGLINEAYGEQRQCSSILTSMFGEVDSRTVEAKSLSESYRRSLTEYKVRLAKERLVLESVEKEELLIKEMEKTAKKELNDNDKKNKKGKIFKK
jgi:tetratricopeptide (TPR) repeat protein